MRNRVAFIISLIAVLAVAGPLAACGEEEHSGEPEAVEGEPLELGELLYNVAITRFLNPSLVDDAEYLAGQPEEPAGMSYLGVFLTIVNEDDAEELPSATSYHVTDASHRVFEPVETDTPYALEVGAPVPAGGELPLDDSTAATGQVEGAVLLFLVEDDVSEERPLELEIDSMSGSGIIELDI